MEMHPIHEKFLKTCPSNSAPRLLELMDVLPSKARDSLLIPTAISVLQPKTRNPESVHETTASLFDEHVSYSRFKAKLVEMTQVVPGELVVLAVVHRFLSTIYGFAHFDLEKIIANHRGTIARLQGYLEQDDLPDWKRSQLEPLIQMSEDKIESLPREQIEHQEFYVLFCDTVLAGLLVEHQESEAEAIDDLRTSIKDLSEEEFPGAPKEGIDNT